MATTLTNLIDKVRRRSDTVSSQHVTDTDLTDFINDAYAEVYGMFASKNQDWFMADPVSVAITSGNTIATTAAVLGSRMMIFRGIDYSTGGDYVPLRPFRFDERGVWQSSSGSVTGTYRIWYIPEMTKLSGASDEVHTALAATDIEQYIVLQAAAAALAKGERDTTVQERAAQRIMQQLEFRAATRGQPKAISDDDGSPLPTRNNARNDRTYRLRGAKIEIYSGRAA